MKQNISEPTYTTGLENEMWNIIGDDYNESITLGFLNSSHFRSFGESLSTIIERKMPEGRKANPQAFLKSCAQDKGIVITSVNTYTNWFKHNSRPRKSMESRETMFRIAFALDLTIAETVDLFHKAYLDRAFDHRQYQEVIYYYCLDHGLSYQRAKEMISMVNFSETDQTDAIIRTILLKSNAIQAESDMELIHFINTHPNNYNTRSSITGLEKIREWKKRASLCANEEVDLTGRWDEYKNRSGDSVNFLYSVITNQASNDEHGTRTSFRNALLPKEIKQNFPQPSVFAEANPSYEEVRKLIILLFSYTAWYRMQFGKSEYDKNYEYDVYYDELNNILFEANMPMLYAGNPYDWLFMRCAAEDNPLDAFRGILGEALSEEDF